MKAPVFAPPREPASLLEWLIVPILLIAVVAGIALSNGCTSAGGVDERAARTAVDIALHILEEILAAQRAADEAEQRAAVAKAAGDEATAAAQQQIAATHRQRASTRLIELRSQMRRTEDTP